MNNTTLSLKRIFDLTVSLILLVILSPVFILIAIAIRAESEGPIFYTSKRVGQDWRVFDFFKFRTMRINADALIKDIQHLNAYAQNTDLPGPDENGMEQHTLISDEGWVSEVEMAQVLAKASFLKVVDDPRITKVGRVLRNTSLDELPQLFNVVKGDMSLVGNRPLPLYEAETLTTDRDAERFLAPAGITGLWQVTERGGREVSEARRKQLDIEYARIHNFKFDLQLLFRTLYSGTQRVNA